MVRLADENPDMLLLMNDTELTDGDLNSVGLTKLGQIKSAGLSLNSYVMGCCCAFRRELLDLCMPIPEGFGSHDRWIVDFASNLEAKLVDPTVLQYYRRHDSNESEFIVNRTVKVSRIDVLTSGIKLLFSDSLEAKEMLRLRQLYLRYEGIRRAITVSPDSRVQLLKDYLLINDRLLRVTEKRAVIRNKRFFARLAAILRMAIEGDYRHSSGIKAIFRDVIG